MNTDRDLKAFPNYNAEDLKKFLKRNKNIIENITIHLYDSRLLFRKINNRTYYYIDKIFDLLNVNQKSMITCKLSNRDTVIKLGYLRKKIYS